MLREAVLVRPKFMGGHLKRFDSTIINYFPCCPNLVARTRRHRLDVRACPPLSRGFGSFPPVHEPGSRSMLPYRTPPVVVH